MVRWQLLALTVRAVRQRCAALRFIAGDHCVQVDDMGAPCRGGGRRYIAYDVLVLTLFLWLYNRRPVDSRMLHDLDMMLRQSSGMPPMSEMDASVADGYGVCSLDFSCLRVQCASIIFAIVVLDGVCIGCYAKIVASCTVHFLD